MSGAPKDMQIVVAQMGLYVCIVVATTFWVFTSTVGVECVLYKDTTQHWLGSNLGPPSGEHVHEKYPPPPQATLIQ